MLRLYATLFFCTIKKNEHVILRAFLIILSNLKNVIIQFLITIFYTTIAQNQWQSPHMWLIESHRQTHHLIPSHIFLPEILLVSAYLEPALMQTMIYLIVFLYFKLNWRF